MNGARVHCLRLDHNEQEPETEQRSEDALHMAREHSFNLRSAWPRYYARIPIHAITPITTSARIINMITAF